MPVNLRVVWVVFWVGLCFSCGTLGQQEVERVRTAIHDVGVLMVQTREEIRVLCIEPPPDAPPPKFCPKVVSIFDKLQGIYAFFNDNAPS